MPLVHLKSYADNFRENGLLNMILASDPSLPPVHSLPTQYKPSCSLSSFYFEFIYAFFYRFVYIDSAVPLSTLMRPVMPPDDLALYPLHSRVAHSCLPTRLLRPTAYYQELHSLLDCTRFVRAGLMDISMLTSPLHSSFFS